MSACVGGVMCCVHDRKSLDGSSNAFCSDTVSLCQQLPISSYQAINNTIANMLLALHNPSFVIHTCSWYEMPGDLQVS